MPYIGKSPTNGVRTRFLYTASANQTAFSGSDSASNVLTYSDGMYMDVYQKRVRTPLVGLFPMYGITLSLRELMQTYVMD